MLKLKGRGEYVPTLWVWAAHREFLPKSTTRKGGKKEYPYSGEAWWTLLQSGGQSQRQQS